MVLCFMLVPSEIELFNILMYIIVGDRNGYFSVGILFEVSFQIKCYELNDILGACMFVFLIIF